MSKYHRNFAPEAKPAYAGPPKPRKPSYRCGYCGVRITKEEYACNKGDCGECREVRVRLNRSLDAGPQQTERPKIIRDIAVQLRRKAVYQRW